MPAKKWTSGKVVKEISRLHREGARLNSRSARKQYSSLFLGAYRYCGGWKQAIEAAGIEYDSVCKKERAVPIWTEDKIISAIKKRHADRLPLNYRAMALAGEDLIKGAVRRFGSWEAAITAAGLDYSLIRKKELRKWSKNKIAQAILKRYWDGLSIKGAEVSEQDKGLYIAARRHFGKQGWAKAREYAGFDPIDPRPWTKWNQKNTVEEILHLYENGVSLNISSLQMSNYSYAIAAGRKIFGSWAKAVHAAGLNYKAICLRRPVLWTKSRIVSRIQELEQNGIRLNTKNIQPRFGGLFRSATKRFGCWSQAVEAAGINYLQHCRKWSTKAWVRRMNDSEYQARLK